MSTGIGDGDDRIYRPPASGLDVQPPMPDGDASLERALHGEIRFSVGQALRDGWRLVDGSKWPIFAGTLVSFMVGVASVLIDILMAGGLEDLGEGGGSSISSLTGLLTVPITAGSFLFAIKRVAGDASASVDDVFSQYPHILRYIGMYILLGILVVLGLILLVIPGVYLAVSYIFAFALAADRGMGAWESLETSRKIITRCWFEMFGLGVALFFVVALAFAAIGLVSAVVGALVFGSAGDSGTMGGGMWVSVAVMAVVMPISIIWIYPFGYLTFASAYVQIVGYGGQRA